MRQKVAVRGKLLKVSQTLSLTRILSYLCWINHCLSLRLSLIPLAWAGGWTHWQKMWNVKGRCPLKDQEDFSCIREEKGLSCWRPFHTHEWGIYDLTHVWIKILQVCFALSILAGDYYAIMTWNSTAKFVVNRIRPNIISIYLNLSTRNTTSKMSSFSTDCSTWLLYGYPKQRSSFQSPEDYYDISVKVACRGKNIHSRLYMCISWERLRLWNMTLQRA